MFKSHGFLTQVNKGEKLKTKIITITQLQVGDVILSTTSDPVSWAVRTGTNSRFSHARLYIGNGKIIEAIEPQVRKQDLTEIMQHDLYTAVYRADNVTQSQKKIMVSYAQKQLKKEYDLSGAMGTVGFPFNYAGIDNLIDSESDFYCSELVAFAYKRAGLKLAIMPSQVTPKYLANNQQLKYIGHLGLPKPKARDAIIEAAIQSQVDNAIGNAGMKNFNLF